MLMCVQLYRKYCYYFIIYVYYLIEYTLIYYMHSLRNIRLVNRQVSKEVKIKPKNMRPVILVQITGFQKDENSIKMQIYLQKKSPAKFYLQMQYKMCFLSRKKEAPKSRQRNKKYSFSVKNRLIAIYQCQNIIYLLSI